MEPINTEELVIMTNVGLIIVSVLLTAATAWGAWLARVANKEAHRHEEHQTEEMAHIVHEVLQQEMAMQAEANRHQEAEEDTK